MNSRVALLREWVIGNRIPLMAAAVHVMLAAYYSVSYPILESSDENTHFFFVWRLSRTASIPDVRFESGPWVQEATQGPLYYLSAAIPIAFVDTHDAEDYVAHRNPFVNLGDASRPGNKNLFIHDPRRESWPWHGTTLAVYMARWVSALYGALAVWGTYHFVRRMAPGAAGASALFVALLPQLIWTSGSVTNDSAIAGTAALSLWILASAPRDWPVRNLIALGVALGLAALSKLPGLLLTLYVFGWMFLLAISRGWRVMAMRLGVMAAAFLAIAGPWLVMNLIRYGDPTAVNAHLVMVGDLEARPYSAESILQIFSADFFRLIPGHTISIIGSLWGVFGAHNIVGPGSMYALFNALGAVGLVGFGINFIIESVHQVRHAATTRGWIRRLQETLDTKPMWQLWLIGWPLINLAFLLVWTSRAGGVAGRLMFPALPVIAFICAVGWWRLSSWLPTILRRVILAVQPAALGLFAVAAPAWLIMPAYVRPVEVNNLPSSAALLNLHYGALELVGIDSQKRVQPGKDLAVTFYWRLTEPTPDEYTIFPRLLDGQLTPVAGTNAYPGWGSWPVTLWEPGVIYQDRYVLPVAPDAERPSLGRVILAVEVDHVLQKIVAADGNEFDPTWPLAEVALAPEAVRFTSAADNTLATFGDSVVLLAATYPETVHAGDSLELQLVWQAKRQVGESWQRFVHLDDGNRAQPKVWAQHDSIPANGYGLNWWQPGETVPDTVNVLTPPDLPSGTYALWVGLTDAAGQRISVAGGDVQDGRLYLGPITVR